MGTTETTTIPGLHGYDPAGFSLDPAGRANHMFYSPTDEVLHLSPEQFEAVIATMPEDPIAAKVQADIEAKSAATAAQKSAAAADKKAKADADAAAAQKAADDAAKELKAAGEPTS